MKKIVISLLILMAVVSGAVFAEITTVVVKNQDNTLTRVFYSGGKEIARQVKDAKNNVIKTSGKIPDGIVKEFNDDGKLLFEWNYKNGKLNGTSKSYFLSGELLEEMIYKDNKQEGMSKKYYKSGKLLAERYFESNELEGVTRMYTENGTVLAELNYKNGKLDGESKMYYENGKLKTVQDYKSSRKINVKSYDPQGKMLFDHDYTSNKIMNTTTTMQQLRNTNIKKTNK